MTALVWDQVGGRRYESGIDRGVLYPVDGPGVVWNGLISVNETSFGGELSTTSDDGITYLNSINARNYQATIKAFSSPREFGPCVGDLEVVPGFTLTRQNRKRFGLAYRTMLGASDYKLHIVYNASAIPTARSYATSNNTPNPINLEWNVTAVPPILPGFRPTAHFIIESTKARVDGLTAIENQLYGTDDILPTLPTLDVILDLLANADYIHEFLDEPL